MVKQFLPDLGAEPVLWLRAQTLGLDHRCGVECPWTVVGPILSSHLVCLAAGVLSIFVLSRVEADLTTEIQATVFYSCCMASKPCPFT